MGISQSKKYTKSTQTSELQSNFKKEIQSQLKVITCWSLQQTREMCLLYKRYSHECPYLSRFAFKKIFQFPNNISNEVFDCFTKGQKFLSFYQFICAVLLTSYNTLKRKLQFLYLVFNFTHEQSLKLKHFFLIYQCMAYAFCRITDQQLPNFLTLKKILFQEYLTSQSIQILENNFQFRKLIEEVEVHSITRQMFQRFEGDVKGSKQKPFVYMLNGLAKYDKKQSERILKIIKNVYQEKNFEQIQIHQKNKKFRLENRKSFKLQLLQQDKQRQLKMTSTFRIKNRSYSMKKMQGLGSKIIYSGHIQPEKNQTFYKAGNSRLKLFRSNSVTFRQTTGNLGLTSNKKDIRSVVLQSIEKSKKNDKMEMIENQKQKISPSKFKKPISMVFLGGKAYSKSAFFETIQYFNTLSNGKQEIKIKQFFKTFENKAFLRKQLSNFFDYFDKNGNGVISFEQFIKAIYPTIDNRFFQRIKAWNIDYKNIYQADKIIIRRQNKNTKIELPSQTTQRIKQIFDSFGGQKGYLIYEDIKNAYQTGFNMQQCGDIIKQYGFEGKIYIEGFARMLLPEGFIIQNCNWHIKRTSRPSNL